MGRLRESFDAMSPGQRATLALLASVVLVVAVLALVLAAGRGSEDPVAGDTSTSVPPTTAPTTSTSTSSTTTSTSTTTTTAPDTTSTSTSTTIPSLPELRGDGIGEWDFGEPAEPVLGEMLALLGDPDDDTGWVDQMENYGVCLGTTVRFVRWGSLQAFFTDGPSDWASAGERHFASYTQATLFDGAELAFSTADGLALGTPVGDVRAIHGTESVYDDPLYGPVFFVDPPGPSQLWGSVSGLDPDDTIEVITGSYACGE